MNAILERIFTDHPATVGESYAQHLRFASRTGLSLLAAGLAAIAHGLFPCLFQRTSSSMVLGLALRMRQRFPDHPALPGSRDSA